MRILAVLAFGPLMFLAACSNSAAEAPSATVGPIAAAEVSLPAQVLGLKTVRENVAPNLADFSRSYLSGVGLFSFRESNNLLRATLQVARFNTVAEENKAKFRDSIIGQLGSSVPIEIRVGGKQAFLATGSDQNIFAWFDTHNLYVLSIRSDYAFPRTMLRTLIDTKLSS